MTVLLLRRYAAKGRRSSGRACGLQTVRGWGLRACPLEGCACAAALLLAKVRGGGGGACQRVRVCKSLNPARPMCRAQRARRVSVPAFTAGTGRSAPVPGTPERPGLAHGVVRPKPPNSPAAPHSRTHPFIKAPARLGARPFHSYAVCHVPDAVRPPSMHAGRALRRPRARCVCPRHHATAQRHRL